MQDEDLDRLLAAAAERAPEPSDALMERVLAEAYAHQPGPLRLEPGGRSAKGGLWSRLVTALGGPPALAGLGTAAVFGLAIGYLSPTTLDYVTGTSAESAEFFPDADFLTTEG